MSDFQSNRAFNTQPVGPYRYLLPPLIMPGPQTRTLWCFVNHRDYDPAPVSVPESVNINYLKEAIKEKFGLHDVSTHRLVLWKLNDPEPLDPEDTLANRFTKKGDARTFATMLAAERDVLTFFPQPPLEDHVHILVQLPSTRTAPYQATEILQSDHPLHELWMLVRVPEQTLFETRPVQRDNTSEIELPPHCMVLKGGHWIEELHPFSASFLKDILVRDEYKETLRALMEWFLHGILVTEDTMEVDDMQPVPFENPFLNAPRGHISNQGAFVLLGHPGIGKTVFLYVLLVLRLQARLPTIYQSRDDCLYYFDDNGVSMVDLPTRLSKGLKSQFDPSAWCLIDSNDNLNTIPAIIKRLNLFTVQASSPHPYRFDWMKKAERKVLRFFMKSWTLSELLVGRVLQGEVCTEKQIENFSEIYGTSARSVYIYSSTPSIYDTIFLDNLRPLTYEELGKISVRANSLDLSGPVSHQIILIHPGTSRDTFDFSFPSRYIYEKLRDKLSNTKLVAIALMYEVFVRVPKTKSPAGLMLEDAVTDVFPRGGEWGLVRMERSSRTGSKFTHWKAPEGHPSLQYLHLGFEGHPIIGTNPNPVGTKYNELIPLPFVRGTTLQLKDGYYIPLSPIQATFDGFIYESANETATVLQVTTSSTHSVKEEGLEWLWNLGIKQLRYIAVSPPDNPLDLPFPNNWDSLIPEKYLLIVESLLTPTYTR